jgi:hypothetical protein
VRRIMRTRDGVAACACIACILVLLLAGCASLWRPASAPGPGVPWIANLHIDPDSVKAGETAQMTFYFEVGSADIQEAFLVDSGIQQFRFFQDLQPMTIDLKLYSGQVAAWVQLPVRWTTEGVRLVDFYVVTKSGKVSNHLNARVTVW